MLGAVPLQDPELAAGELVELMTGGAFAGVEVTTSVNGDYLGDRRFEPFWSAAEQCDALVFVHPTTRGFALPVLDRHYMWNLVGNPIETTIAAADLVLGGTMVRHPKPEGAARPRRRRDRGPERSHQSRPEDGPGGRTATAHQTLTLPIA